MASGPLRIKFVADVADFLRGIGKAEQATEELTDEFKDLERDADRAADDIEDSFRDIGRAAQRAGDDIDQGLSGGLRDGDLKSTAGALAGEVVDEFVENWGEAVRSGDYASAFRETLSQLGQIGGAIGGPAGAAIGGGIALAATTTFDQLMNTEGKAKLAASLKASTDEIDVDLGDVGYQSGQTYIQGYDRAMREQANRENALIELYGVDSYEAALREAAREVDNLGIAWGALEDVTAGTTTETAAAVGNLERQRDVIDKEIAAAYETAKGPANNLTTEQQKQVEELRAQRARINELITLGEDRLGTVRETAAGFDAQAQSLVRVEGKVGDVRRALLGLPDKHSTDVEINYQGSIARFNAAMFAATRPRYQEIFISEIRRDSAAASRGGNQVAE